MPEAGGVSPEVWTKMLMQVAGLSSEFIIWIAALTLPSSSFAVTACNSRAESDAEWRPEWAVFVYPASEAITLRRRQSGF